MVPAPDLRPRLLHRLRREDVARRARGDRAEQVARGRPPDRQAGCRTRGRSQGNRRRGSGTRADGGRSVSRRPVLRRAAVIAAAALAALASSVLAHDLFIKLDSYFLKPGAAVRVPVLNGTFSSSENAITRARIADLSLMTPVGRTPIDTAAVSARRDSTFIAVRLGGAGTY